MSDDLDPALTGIEQVPGETAPGKDQHSRLARIARRRSATNGKLNDWLVVERQGRRHGPFVVIDGAKVGPEPEGA